MADFFREQPCNLNQIARHLNTTGDLRDWGELREAMTLHKAAIGRVLAL
jgi:hypothetical protein